MLKRLPQENQLELFGGATLYLSQGDAAKALGITTRMIQYWHSHELLNPELPQEGRSRRYTSFDLVELRFIKGLVVDQGFTIPSLKEKLEELQAPYYYDPEDAFWDLKDQCWKSRSDLGCEHFQNLREELEPTTAQALEALLPGDPERAAGAVLDMIRLVLLGKKPKRPRKRGAKKKK